ncbi:MAG: ATP-binding cassette domain-containing protein [Actinomadura sp.]
MFHPNRSGRTPVATSAEPSPRAGADAPAGEAWAIRTVALTKSYAGTPALRGVDLTVAPGEIFGFLGPNGAGKTTTIQILSTLIRPSTGDAWVHGHHTVTAAAQVRRGIAALSQDCTLDPDLTAWENLRFHARLHGIPATAARSRARDLLDLLDLTDRRNDLVRTFSGGMRRRLEIIRSILHSPRLLFLDEPTAGLDPQSRAQVWTHLRDQRRRQALTMFVTTHQMNDAEHCDRIAIINKGRIVACDTPNALRAKVGLDRIHLRTSDDRRAAAEISQAFAVQVTPQSAGLIVDTGDGAALIPRLCALLTVPIEAITLAHPTLDDVFFALTDHTIDPRPFHDGSRESAPEQARS